MQWRDDSAAQRCGTGKSGQLPWIAICLYVPALGLILSACGTPRSAPGPATGCSCIPVKSPQFADTLREWPSLSTADRQARALRLATELPAGHESREERSFRQFADELAAACYVQTLDWLNTKLDAVPQADRKMLDLHWALIRRDDQKPVRALLQRMASGDEANIILAPYRSGGLIFLLTIVEDETLPASDRVLAVWRLGSCGDASVLQRLSAWEGDKTEYLSGFSGVPFGDSETVGQHVCRAVADIRARLAN